MAKQFDGVLRPSLSISLLVFPTSLINLHYPDINDSIAARQAAEQVEKMYWFSCTSPSLIRIQN
ncbi:hypothetical protein [Gloeothece verrucosa]|uniref:Uncharacterized protein n=1 Tax=Gloeothece verrucosa (strain PCC 7822) TaxID=497965 RepID=E0UMV8_GLOV7|nr:hypothetical protein [Gloeothece verrucosa]ADN18288.1 hypothetical protein Cyan7822_6514 [Gloeothece verrucosa PCC 7822]